MAITYLSGERIQGASNAEGTPVVITGWTTNNATDVAGLLTKTSTTDSWSDCCNNTDSVENYATGTAYKFKYSNASTSATHNVRVGIAQSAVTDNSGITHGFLLTDYVYELDGTTLTQIDSSPSATDYYVMEIATSGAITRKQYASDGTLKYSNSSGTITGTGWFQNSTMYYGGETIKITNIPLVDEKTTVTDVPTGSEFQETDTRKFYQRSAEVSVWSQILSSSYSQVNNTNTSEDTRMGQQFESGHANIGKTFDTVTIRLRNRYSSGLTYEIPMKVWLNGSTSPTHTSETTVTLDELQTGTTWDSSAPYDDAVTYTFATPITIGTNDIIGIQPSGGTTDSSSVIIREKNLAEADTKMISYRSGAWGTIFDDEDLYMTISLSPRWVERGTAI